MIEDFVNRFLKAKVWCDIKKIILRSETYSSLLSSFGELFILDDGRSKFDLHRPF